MAETNPRRPKLQRKLAALSLLGLELLQLGRISPLAQPTRVQAAETAAKTIELVVDYGDGVQKRFTSLAWAEGMTLLDAMKAAKKHSHGIDFEYVGEGEMAFLQSIDAQKNQGGGDASKNWVFRLNQKLGHKSFAVQTLAAGDVVLWRFEVYDH